MIVRMSWPTLWTQLMPRSSAAWALILGHGLSTPSHAAPSDRLLVYCSAPARHCAKMASAFELKTGIKTSHVHLDGPAAFARIKAETNNPKADIWWGGSILLHANAAELGLTQEYEPARLWQLRPWAVAAAWASNYRTVGIHAIRQTYSFDRSALGARGLRPPMCWRDLTAPEFRGLIEVDGQASPRIRVSSVIPLVSVLGEADAIDLVKQMLARPASSQSDTIDEKGLRQLDPLISVVLDDREEPAAAQGVWTSVAACEGASFAMSAMSIVSGSSNFTEAEAWVDWALSVDGQAISQRFDFTLVPSSRSMRVPQNVADEADMFLGSKAFQQTQSVSTRQRIEGKLQSIVDDYQNK